MARVGLRIGILGATGALGGEVLAVLSESGLPVAEIVPMAKDDSIGRDVELNGEVYAVESGLTRLRGLDFVILCAPAAASLDAVREALRASVPCIDASGALAASPDVALQVAAFGARWSPDAPLLVTPPGPALALALVLRPLALAAGLVRVTATLLEGASNRGRAGIDALYQESLALFNQQDLPDPGVFERPVAFDCIPVLGELDENGGSDHENALVRSLARLLGDDLKLGVTAIQVPTFSGLGASVALETARPLDPKEAAQVLAAAPGVETWTENPRDATTRAAAGRSSAVVARLRRDPTSEHSLALWIAADPLRLCATNAVGLAATRFGGAH
jgi:aspartate-semialdehyde dehydrogenase